MKISKNLGLIIFGEFLAVAGLFSAHSVYARLTGTNPTGASADVACWGPKGKEICVDSSGNIIPTTTATQNLGSASLTFNAMNVSGTATLSGADTISGTATLSGPIVYPPSATGVTGTVTIAYPSVSVLTIKAIAGNVTNTALPTISTAGVAVGTLLHVVNVGTTGAVTLDDEAANTGSGLRLDAASVTLQPANDYAIGATGLHGITLIYTGGTGADWTQVGQ